ncbi:MAG: T9SS type A sorting domain-containing protein [Bacteroidia bacterium]|nr:T9SS type A sorting domain-containing protein [Bacteroidia bacterium]
MSVNTNQEVLFNIINSTGQTVISKEIWLTPGENRLSQDIREIPSGIYYVLIKDRNGNIHPAKFIRD